MIYFTESVPSTTVDATPENVDDQAEKGFASSTMIMIFGGVIGVAVGGVMVVWLLKRRRG